VSEFNASRATAGSERSAASRTFRMSQRIADAISSGGRAPSERARTLNAQPVSAFRITSSSGRPLQEVSIEIVTQVSALAELRREFGAKSFHFMRLIQLVAKKCSAITVEIVVLNVSSGRR
jgi:hypothetical protein